MVEVIGLIANKIIQPKINDIKVRRLKNNVHLHKDDKIIFTDNAIQYISNDIFISENSEILINGEYIAVE